MKVILQTTNFNDEIINIFFLIWECIKYSRNISDLTVDHLENADK